MISLQVKCSQSRYHILLIISPKRDVSIAQSQTNKITQKQYAN